MVGHTSKTLQQMLQDFLSVPDDFGTSCIKGLKTRSKTIAWPKRTLKLTKSASSIKTLQRLL